MHPEEEYMDVLQNLEFAVIRVWKDNRQAMSDHTVLRVYEALIKHYTAIARGREPKATELTGLDVKLFAAVQQMCEWRLGKGPAPGEEEEVEELVEEEELPTIPVADLVECLKRLRKSVERWNRGGGRQGYLEYIEKFLP